MLILQQLISGLMIGGIYVMVAVAFTLTIGMLNFLNFDTSVVHVGRHECLGIDHFGGPLGSSIAGGRHNRDARVAYCRTVHLPVYARPLR